LNEEGEVGAGGCFEMFSDILGFMVVAFVSYISQCFFFLGKLNFTIERLAEEGSSGLFRNLLIIFRVLFIFISLMGFGIFAVSSGRKFLNPIFDVISHIEIRGNILELKAAQGVSVEDFTINVSTEIQDIKNVLMVVILHDN